MFFGEYKESCPKWDPENLSVFFIHVIAASKISLFLFVQNFKSPNKSKSFLTSERFKIVGNDCTLSIRSKRY